MSINPNLSDALFLEIDDPVRLLTRLSERDELDYKLALNKERDEQWGIIKCVAAMANSGGGLIIFGVDAAKSELRGVDEDQLNRLDPANFQGLLRKHLSPVPRILTESVNHDGKIFAFVSIASITDCPVLISGMFQDANGRMLLREGALFVRDNTRSIEVTGEAQARKILDRVVAFQVRAKLRELLPVLELGLPKHIAPLPSIEVLGRKQAEELVNVKSDTPARELILSPFNRDPRFTEEQIKSAFRKTVKLDGLSLPHNGMYSERVRCGRSEGGLVAYMPSIESLDGRRRYSRVERDGGLYWCSSLVEDFQAEVGVERLKNGIGIISTIEYVVLAVRFVDTYMRSLQINEPIGLTFGFRNVKGRRLVVEDNFNRIPLSVDRISMDQHVNVQVDFAPAEVSELQAVSLSLCMNLIRSLNWPDPNESQFIKDIASAFQRSAVLDAMLDL